jgi:SAM-dependent methyltransferase
MGDDSEDAGVRQARRARSFGDVASSYERFRPGPPSEVIAWMLPAGASTVVDLGAGTGAMTKDLVGGIDHVIAIEPDDRMRRVLAENLPGVQAVKGVGESIPLGDGSVDAVLASSSWHWMDADLALGEAARVLVPSGTLAAVWTGPDPDGAFVAQAQALLSEMSSGGVGSDGNHSAEPDLGATVVDSENRVEPVLRIPDDSPFAQPEQLVLTWDVALSADELIGLLGTFSWIITMTDDRRAHVIAEVRRVLRDGLGVSGDVTVDVQYRCEAWRTRLARP